MTGIVRAARERVVSEHGHTVDAIGECADAVARSWDEDHVHERCQVVDPLRQELETTGVVSDLPRVLVDAVDATGNALSAPPVPAPPYVVVTSRGPILRASLPIGRLIIRFDVFSIRRRPSMVYRHKPYLELVTTLVRADERRRQNETHRVDGMSKDRAAADGPNY